MKNQSEDNCEKCNKNIVSIRMDIYSNSAERHERIFFNCKDCNRYWSKTIHKQIKRP